MNLTDVIFKIDSDGDVFAMFPGLAGTNDIFTCSGYRHLGQHRRIQIGYHKGKRFATEAEYNDLKKELEGPEPEGYNLRVVKRFTTKHFRERREQLSY